MLACNGGQSLFSSFLRPIPPVARLFPAAFGFFVSLVIHLYGVTTVIPLALHLKSVFCGVAKRQVGDDLDLPYGARTAAASGASVVLAIGALIGTDGAALQSAVVQVRNSGVNLAPLLFHSSPDVIALCTHAPVRRRSCVLDWRVVLPCSPP